MTENQPVCSWQTTTIQLVNDGQNQSCSTSFLIAWEHVSQKGRKDDCNGHFMLALTYKLFNVIILDYYKHMLRIS